jgi:ribosomal protein L40E
MALIEAKGRPHLLCGKCKAVLVLPDTLDMDERREVARLRRADVMAAIEYLTRHHALDSREAKAVASHIPPTAGVCTRCHTPIPKGGTACPKCRSFNLNW